MTESAVQRSCIQGETEPARDKRVVIADTFRQAEKRACSIKKDGFRFREDGFHDLRLTVRPTRGKLRSGKPEFFPFAITNSRPSVVQR